MIRRDKWYNPPMTMKALVLIPTYNEKENIAHLIKKVMKTDRRLHVLVIDDGSPDGTAEIVQKFASESHRVSLLNRGKKLGLGTAYVEGMKRAMVAHYDAIVTMDADFSHPVEKLPEMLDALDDYGMAVGSRYVEGGGSEGWPFHRRMMSAIANAFARAFTGTPVRDITSGFNALTRESVEIIKPERVTGKGFVFVTELKFRARRAGVTITEVPIVFRDREAGGSKMSVRQVLGGLFHLLKVRLKG